MTINDLVSKYLFGLAWRDQGFVMQDTGVGAWQDAGMYPCDWNPNGNDRLVVHRYSPPQQVLKLKKPTDYQRVRPRWDKEASRLGQLIGKWCQRRDAPCSVQVEFENGYFITTALVGDQQYRARGRSIHRTLCQAIANSYELGGISDDGAP